MMNMIHLLVCWICGLIASLAWLKTAFELEDDHEDGDLLAVVARFIYPLFDVDTQEES